jgi:hypothetical protein
MTDISAAWMTGLLMATMLVTVVYFIVTREWLPWRAFVRDMGMVLSGRPSDGGAIRFEHEGRPCQVTLYATKHGASQFWLAVQADVALTLSLHRRGTGDAMAAAAGLVVPLATGHLDVDRQWLIGCADAARATSLLADAGLRSSLGALLRAGAHTVVWSAEDRAVWVRGDLRRDVQRDVSVLKMALGLAVGSSRALVTSRRKPWPARAGVDIEAPSAGTTTWVIVGLAIPALATLPVIGLDVAFPPLDRSPAMWAAAAFALAATALLYRLARCLSKRSVLEHRAVLMMLPIYAVGFWILAYGAIVCVNGAADTATAAEIEGRIQLPIQPAYGRPPEHRLQTTEGIYTVSESLHAQARQGDSLRVATRPGRLGMSWRDAQDDVQLSPRR